MPICNKCGSDLERSVHVPVEPEDKLNIKGDTLIEYIWLCDSCYESVRQYITGCGLPRHLLRACTRSG